MFGKRYFLNRDAEEWHLKTWSWLLEHSAKLSQLPVRSQFVLPTTEFFPKTNTEGDDRVIYVAEHVRRLAGMSDWGIEVQLKDPPDHEIEVALDLRHEEGHALGTFQVDSGGKAIMEVRRDLADDPHNLIATIAHEFGHYFNGGFSEPPPGGWEMVEPATDVTSIFLGFGLFALNSRYNEKLLTGDLGSYKAWSYSGYLSEPELLFDTAIFCRHFGYDPVLAEGYLKPPLMKSLLKAIQYLEKTNIDKMMLT